MAIYTTCQCGKTIGAKTEHAGKRGRCPACGAQISFPAMTARPATGYDVFISHSKDDKLTASAMCSALEASGIRCWIAPRDIVPGKEWGEAIIDGISQCPVMILIFSSHSNQSQQVRREVERAVNKETIIIPFRIEDVPMSKSMEYFLSSPHWLDALTPPLENHLQSLTKTVKLLLAEKGRTPDIASPPKVVPAKPAEPVVAAIVPSRAAAWWPIALVLGIAGAGVGLILLVVAGLLVSRLRIPAEPRTVATAGSVSPPTAESSLPAPPPSSTPGTTPVSVPPAGGSPPNPSSPGTSNDAGASPAARSTAPAIEGASEAAVAASLVAGAPPSAAGPDPSSWDLRGGKLILQTAGVDVYGRSSQADASATKSNPETPPKSKRVILITNQRSSTPASPAIDSEARISFQVSNLSQEQVTLSRLQLHLVGIVQHYEDRIAEPISPRVVKYIDDLEVQPGSGPKTVAEMAKVFADDDTPWEHLEFKATSSDPAVVQPAISDGRLVLRFPSGSPGLAYVVAEVTDPFGLSGVCGFEVRIKGYVPPVTESLVVGNPVIPRTGVNFESPVPRTGVAPINAPEVEPTIDLGEVALDHRLSRLEVLAPSATGNLLPATGDPRRPNTIRPFKLRISPRLLLTPPAAASEDAMVGFKDPRRKLAARPPRLTRAWHVFQLSAAVTSAAGAEQNLDCGLLVLESAPPAPAADENPDKQTRPLDLLSGYFYKPDQFLTRLGYETLRTYQQTPAYDRATLCAAVPEGFDPGKISEMCYFGDAGSPFRDKTFAPRFSATSRWPRSNLADSLSSLRSGLPALSKQLESAIVLLADDENQEQSFRVRMAYLRDKLAAGAPREQPTTSLVRVVRE